MVSIRIDQEEKMQAEEAIRKAYAQTELLLSSIPSLLIGVNEEGLITHWNTVAERIFGISSDSVLKRPFSDCKVDWDAAVLSAGIRECRKKGLPVRLDDVRFRRPHGQEGFLGITILPVRQEANGPIECVLFGADITERKQIDELKNEFVSTVSHELRTPLTVVKEGVSQVLDGILGKINRKQRQFLTLSLKAIDRLGRIVDDLLDISKIESGRFELRRRPVDIVRLAKSAGLAFKSQAEEKGLKIRTQFPNGGLEVYVDEDRIVQVFTNLIANALKFTERGEIKISVADKGGSVECRIEDTGIGISPKDLPSVFGKFQQFYRAAGPEEKGTGLGLAICKGIVESHQGEIRVESEAVKGTKFTFNLPKYTARQLFKEHIARSLKEALNQEASLSVIIFNVENFDALRERIGPEKTTHLIQALEDLIQRDLRRRADVAIKDTRALLVLLPNTRKEEALVVAGRIQQSFDAYLSKQRSQSPLEISCKVASFPDDGMTAEELLNKTGGW